MYIYTCVCERGHVYDESDRIFWRRPRKDQLQCRSIRVRVRVRVRRTLTLTLTLTKSLTHTSMTGLCRAAATWVG